MLILKPTKRIMILACLTVITFGAFSITNPGVEQTANIDSNYVVIGAFSFKNNARRFTQLANDRNLEADFNLNVNRNLYYVYVYSSGDHDLAVMEVEKIRMEYPEFYDAWVFRGRLGESGTNSSHLESSINDEQADVEISSDQQGTRSSNLTVDNETIDEEVDEPASNTPEPQMEATSSDIGDNDEPVGIVKKEGIYNLYFNTVNAQNLREVKGKMKIIDPVRAKKIKTANSHEIVEVKDPNNGAKKVMVSTEIFGYRPAYRFVSLAQPLVDSTQSYIDIIGDSIIVDFDLQRYRKGDIAVMYNVYFYTNAAIMKPESIYELNSLLDMLQENDNLKVKIHGHTNGNSHGKIKYLDLDDKNFFSLGGNHKEGTGSAKKLSLERAYTIEHWLIEQGVPEERTEIKGWGGKSMIHDKHDTQAHKNVRVEIEILEE